MSRLYLYGAVAVAVALLMAGIYGRYKYELHEAREAGKQEQRAADMKEYQAAYDKAAKDAKVQTDAAQARADAAERKYANAEAERVEWDRTHPVRTVRLCGLASTAAPSSAVSQTSPDHGADASTSGGANGAPSVPRGDSGLRTAESGPDISTLLRSFADLCQGQNDQLNLWHQREGIP